MLYISFFDSPSIQKKISSHVSKSYIGKINLEKYNICLNIMEA